MIELTLSEITQIEGGAPTRKTGFVYDIIYTISYGVTWFLGQGDEMKEAIVRQDLKHVW